VTCTFPAFQTRACPAAGSRRMLVRGDMTARITVERIGDSEVRVTLSAEIRVTGDLGSLLRLQGVPAGEADGRGAAVSLQEFLTVGQAAEVLHVSRDNIYDLIRTRQLRSIKVGRSRRISRQWIAQFAEQRENDENSGR
jgi:excisionase family DNA binding protein